MISKFEQALLLVFIRYNYTAAATSLTVSQISLRVLKVSELPMFENTGFSNMFSGKGW